MRYVIPIIGLLLLIFVHELGHFTAAKRTGMRALRFYIGFPPPIVRRTVRDTEYGIGLIPLGGFVKIPGMLRPEPSDLWAVEDMLHRSEHVPQERASEIGVAHDHITRLIALGRMDEAAVAAGELRDLIAGTEEIGELDRRRARKALERFIESTDPRGYWRSPRRNRLITIAAGPFANILTAFIILTALAVTGMPQPLYPTPAVAGIEKGLPGDRAGLRVGDRIVEVDGHPVRTISFNGHRIGDFAQVRGLISGSGGHAVTLTVRRGTQTLKIGPLRPVRRDGRYIVGFIPDAIATTRSAPVWKAPVEGVSQMWTMISGSVRGIGSEGTSSVSGPVGIVKVSASAADTGAPYYLWLLGYISLSLGILNLLPFLPLDGGHLLLLAIERFRGRALSRATFERVSAFGIALVLFLFLFGLHNDLFGAQPR
ncbi:MAG TPA: M50 family metallopeptidase [Gaiellales bacterium]|jgi:regulator of sigma E protease